MKTLINKNVLEAFPWHELTCPHDVTSFALRHKLKAKPWILEQMLAQIARWPLVKDVAGKIDGEQTVRNAVKSSELNRGIWFLATHDKRGEFVDKQNSLGAPYSALVPLILAAHKKYKSIDYSQWSNTRYCLDPKLEAATQVGEHYEACRSLGSETLLKILNHGLVVQSGPKKGELRSARSSYNIYNLKNIEYGDAIDQLPHLAIVMLLQFWVAHPTVRNKYMILDPNNWDLMPEPLIPDLEISTNKKVDLPW